MNYSRRGLFSLLARPLQSPVAAAKSVVQAVSRPTPASPGNEAPSAAVRKVAIIQGRYCLALSSFCSVCLERCPVTGAMRSDRGLPTVVADVCTGCGVCQEVCPAPTNAILMLPRRRSTPSPP